MKEQLMLMFLPQGEEANSIIHLLCSRKWASTLHLLSHLIPSLMQMLLALSVLLVLTAVSTVSTGTA